MGLHFGDDDNLTASERGTCTTRGSDTPVTHRRRASCSAKPPRPPVRRSSRSLQGLSTERARDGNPARGQCHGETKLAQHAALAAFSVQNSPCSPKMALIGRFCPSRANFISLPPATSRAGRTLYRMTSGSVASQPISATCAAGAEGAGERGGCDTRGQAAAPAGDRAWPGNTQTPPTDWRPPRGLRGLAGLRDDAPSEARGADGERAGRPRGGRRSVGATSSTAENAKQREAARPHRDQAAHTSCDSCQKPQLSQRSRWRRRGRPRR